MENNNLNEFQVILDRQKRLCHLNNDRMLPRPHDEYWIDWVQRFRKLADHMAWAKSDIAF